VPPSCAPAGAAQNAPTAAANIHAEIVRIAFSPFLMSAGRDPGCGAFMPL